MQQLDSRDYVLRNDPKEMYRLTCEFPDQVQRAYDIAMAASLPDWSATPDNVMLTGLGGSAVGGDFVRALFDAFGKVPFVVNRDYHLPSYIGGGSLVFATSYSGNTEETLSAYADAKRAGASIICVTSGGKLAELAKQDGYPCIIIPGGQPPRTALGFMLVPVVVACEKLGLLPRQDFAALIQLLRDCVATWGIETAFDTNPTKKLGAALHGNLSVIYGVGSWQGLVANRWKGQINENSKNMIFANTFPELNHNEILGWVRADGQGVAKWMCIVLEDGTESAKMKKRVEVTSRLIKDIAEIHHFPAPGTTLFEKMMGLVLAGDFVSLYLAALNDVDPENIDSINILKTELSQIP
jgi:glucose/mannose-6-phosphate isomerase